VAHTALRHVQELELKMMTFDTLLPAINKPALLHALSQDALTFHTEQNTVRSMLQTKLHTYVGNIKVQRKTEKCQYHSASAVYQKKIPVLLRNPTFTNVLM